MVRSRQFMSSYRFSNLIGPAKRSEREQEREARLGSERALDKALEKIDQEVVYKHNQISFLTIRGNNHFLT